MWVLPKNFCFFYVCNEMGLKKISRVYFRICNWADKTESTILISVSPEIMLGP